MGWDFELLRRFPLQLAKKTARSNWRSTIKSAFTLIELLVVLSIVAVLACLAVPAIQRGRQRAQRITCVSHLSQIGVATKTFAIDHNDGFPWQVMTNKSGVIKPEAATNVFLHFLVMSNELATPKILRCPADSSRPIANDFATLSNTNISYFLGLDANDSTPNMFLAGDSNLTNGLPVTNHVLFLATNAAAGWSPGLHFPNGNIGFADGVVVLLNNSRLNWAVTSAGAEGRLLMP